MRNLEKLIAAGVVPEDNTLSREDIAVIENLSNLELHCLIDLKETLGLEFLERNGRDSANCIL
jgi:hypothetical protein